MLFCFLLLMVSSAFASDASHLGKMDFELSQLDSKGHSHTLGSLSGEFRLEWKAGQCTVKLRDTEYPCVFNRTTDLLAVSKRVLVKQMPEAHFEGKVLDQVLIQLGALDRDSKEIAAQVVFDTSADRRVGADVPFYTCGDCQDLGAKTPIWNAFESYVEKSIEVKSPKIPAEKWVLKIRLRGLSPVKGSFNIIGRENADSYLGQRRQGL